MFKWLTNIMVIGWAQATKFVTTGGTAAQFVKGDGSLDANVYSTQANIDSSIDAIEIGGRNYFSPSRLVNLALNDYTTISASSTQYKSFYLPVNEGEGYSISRTEITNNRFGYVFTEQEPAPGAAYFGGTGLTPTYYNSLKIEGIVVPANAKYLFLYLTKQNDPIPKIKVEKGNKATDWTPAPEDQVTDWDETNVDSFSFLKNKPTEFHPAAHTHGWAEITGKPTTFPSTAHTHTTAQVTGLQTSLDGKSDKTTTISAGTGLTGGGSLAANRTLAVSYGSTAGTSVQGNDSRVVSAFNKMINALSVTGDVNKTVTLTRQDGTTLVANFSDNNTESPDDVINTMSFNTTTGVITAVTSLGEQITTSIDGRFSLLGHTHALGDIAGLVTALAGKEPVFTKSTAFNKNFGAGATDIARGNHTHTLGNVTGLVTALAGKESIKPPLTFIFSGQSNMEGGETHMNNGGDKTTDSRVKAWSGTAWVTADLSLAPFGNLNDDGVNYNNNLAFHISKRIAEKENREVRIIFDAHGEESISNWVGSGETSTNWVSIKNKITASGATEINGFFWHQGESNALDTTYQDDIQDLINQFRGLSETIKDAPFVAGQLAYGYDISGNTQGSFNGNEWISGEVLNQSFYRQYQNFISDNYFKVADGHKLPTVGSESIAQGVHFQGTALVSYSYLYADAYYTAGVPTITNNDVENDYPLTYNTITAIRPDSQKIIFLDAYGDHKSYQLPSPNLKKEICFRRMDSDNFTLAINIGPGLSINGVTNVKFDILKQNDFVTFKATSETNYDVVNVSRNDEGVSAITSSLQSTGNLKKNINLDASLDNMFLMLPPISYKLDFVIKRIDSTGNDCYLYHNSDLDTGAHIYLQKGDSYYVYSDGTKYITQKFGTPNIVADGANIVVGGGATAHAKLQVGETAKGNGDVVLFADGQGADSGATLSWNMNVDGGNSNSVMAALKSMYSSTVSANVLDFHVGAFNNNNSVGSKKMTLTDTGRLGIDVISPSEKLEVNGKVKATSLKLGNWEIIPNGTSLEFRLSGVAKGRLTSAGVVEASNHKNGLT